MADDETAHRLPTRFNGDVGLYVLNSNKVSELEIGELVVIALLVSRKVGFMLLGVVKKVHRLPSVSTGTSGCTCSTRTRSAGFYVEKRNSTRLVLS